MTRCKNKSGKTRCKAKSTLNCKDAHTSKLV